MRSIKDLMWVCVECEPYMAKENLVPDEQKGLNWFPRALKKMIVSMD